MTATASTNGKPRRKQLSDQLDRMDVIIDALAEALPEAVADACREGARQAVRDAVVEILTSPDLRGLIAGTTIVTAAPVTPDAGPPRPGPWTRFRAGCARARTAAAVRCREAATGLVTVALAVSAVVPVKQAVLVGAAVGLAVGLAAYACPHGLTAALAGAGGACTAVAVQAGRRAYRAIRAAGFLGTD